MKQLKAWLKKSTPWWVRIGAKLVLSRLPAGYAFWQRMGFFRHGYMDESAYALSVFEDHVRSAGWSLSELQGKVILEMGPGDSVATALIAHAYGAKAILIDAGPFATAQPASYGPLCSALQARGLRTVDLNGVSTLGQLLDACSARYLTDGVHAWGQIPSATVDLIFSQAVLEHVRLAEFEEVQRQCRRVLKPAGFASHRVDLKDHLGGALNNLRLPHSVWESEFFARSGFYTNRIRMGRMMTMFEAAGFGVLHEQAERWSTLPTPRHRMAAGFSILPDDELRVSAFDVLLAPASIAQIHGGDGN